MTAQILQAERLAEIVASEEAQLQAQLLQAERLVQEAAEARRDEEQRRMLQPSWNIIDGMQNPADDPSRWQPTPPCPTEATRQCLLRKAAMDAQIAQELEEERDMHNNVLRRTLENSEVESRILQRRRRLLFERNHNLALDEGRFLDAEELLQQFLNEEPSDLLGVPAPIPPAFQP